MAAVAAVQELEVALAQRLASNDKTVRNRALKTLRKYISLRSHKAEGGFTAEDLLKIWKGLFYCLWMQDKPLLQGELSEKISSLIHSFHSSSSQLLFLETFLQTVKREWNGIDRLRMDKFLQLVRFVFRQAFEVLRRKEWDLSLINQFLEVVSVQLFQTTGSVPNGLVLHVLELYLTELGHVGAAELTADQNLVFLGPFFKTLSRTKSRWLLSSICKNIFRNIVDQAAFAIEDLLTELQDGTGEEEEEEEEESRNTRETKRGRAVNGFSEVKGSSDEEDEGGFEKPGSGEDEMGPVLQFDYSAVAERLFQVGGHTSTPNINRTKVYNLVKIFRNLSEGVFPDDGEGSSESSDEDELISFLKMDKEIKKKKKRTKETEEITPKRNKSPEEPNADSDTTEPRRAKKKKKKSKRLKSVEQDVDGDLDSHTETEQGPPETEPQEPEMQTNDGSNKTKKKNKKRKSTSEPESNGAADDVITEEPCGTKSSGRKNKKSRKNSQDRCSTDGDVSEQPSSGVEDGAQPEICTAYHAEPKPKKKKKKKRTGVLMNSPPEGGDEQTAPTTPTPNAGVMSDPQSEDAAPKKKSKKKSKASAEVASSGSEPEICPPTRQDGGKKKRKMPKMDANAPLSNGLTTAGSGKKPKMSVQTNNKTSEESRPSQFISFQGLAKPPTALFCKTKAREAPCTPPSGSIKKCLTPKSETKKVTFRLKNNKTAEFKKTDRSLLVSPVGPSRVAFDPKKRPVSGVLKSPPGFSPVSVKKATPKKRATAADFF